MTLQETLETLQDPDSRPTSKQLVEWSNLDDEEVAQLTEAWPQIAEDRRLSLLSALTDMAEDNIELNFDAVFKVALADDRAELRSAALHGLFEYEGRDLIPKVSAMLRDDSDPAVRQDAAVALGRFAVAAELGYLRDGDTEVLKEILIESVEDLDEDELVRARAIEALGAISGEDSDNLIESVYQEDSLWLKIGAVDAMGRSCNELWLPIIVQEMESLLPQMRHAAAFAAGQIGDEEGIEPLKRMAILDDDPEVRVVAVHALGEIGGPMARVALKSLLYEGDDDLHEAIQEAMEVIAFADDPLNPGL